MKISICNVWAWMGGQVWLFLIKSERIWGRKEGDKWRLTQERGTIDWPRLLAWHDRWHDCSEIKRPKFGLGEWFPPVGHPESTIWREQDLLPLSIIFGAVSSYGWRHFFHFLYKFEELCHLASIPSISNIEIDNNFVFRSNNLKKKKKKKTK